MKMAALLPVLALLGCRSLPAVGGAATGTATGLVTGNPGIAVAVGIGTRAALDDVVKRWGRVRQGAEQDAIADMAGELPIGTAAPWKIRHTVPYGNEDGELTVLRDIDTPLAHCREILFTVRDGKIGHPFTAQLCRRDDRWKWADAEPAVPRWGFLQ